MTTLEGAVMHRPATSALVRALTIGSVALISLTAFESLAVATVMPAVAAALNGLPLYAVGFGAPVASGVVGMALAGLWGDARGPRRPLQIGVLVLCLGLLIAGTAPSMPVFVAGRAVQGLGAGTFSVSIYVLVGSVVPEPLRPRLFAYFAAAWVLPAMIGPVISGLILHAFGWRAVFLLVPALAVPALLLMQPALRATADQAAADLSAADKTDGGPSDAGTTRRITAGASSATARRTLLLAAAAGAGAAALQVAGTRTGPVSLSVVLVAVVLLVWSVPRLLPAGSFRLGRGLPAVIAVRGLIGAAFFGAEAFLPLQLVRERGWSPALAGTVLTTGALTWSTAAWIQGRAADPTARFALARIGTTLLAVGVGVATVSVLPAVPAVTAVVGWAITGAGMGLVYSSLSLLSLHLSPPERHGEASAALQTSESLASALALAVAGAAFAALLPAGIGATSSAGAAPYLAGLSIALVTAVIAVAGALRLAPPTPPTPTTPPTPP
jgi:MFS family permease